MILFRPIDLDRDYDTLLKWWKGHGVPHIPQVILPRGWMAHSAGVEIAASFLYIVESKLAMIEWTTTNPQMCTSRDLVAAVRGLYEHLEAAATAEKCLAMLSMVAPNTGEERIMTKMGYTPQSSMEKLHRMFAKPIILKEAAPCP